jgi:hypothetical protein
MVRAADRRVARMSKYRDILKQIGLHELRCPRCKADREHDKPTRHKTGDGITEQTNITAKEAAATKKLREFQRNHGITPKTNDEASTESVKAVKNLDREQLKPQEHPPRRYHCVHTRTEIRCKTDTWGT